MHDFTRERAAVGRWLVAFLIFAPSVVRAQVVLGSLDTGARVSFVQTQSGQWAIDIAGGSVHILQARPVQLEVFRAETDIRQLGGGYRSVQRSEGGVEARADIPFGDKVVFHVVDRWSLQGAVLSVRRTIEVQGDAPGAAFNSALTLATMPEQPADAVEYFVPSVLYRRAASRADTAAKDSQSFAYREDSMAAPMVGILFGDGTTITMLDPAPTGVTTYEDVGNRVTSVLLDDRITYGAFGTFPRKQGGFEFGFWYPGSLPAPVAVAAESPDRRPRMLRRYHRIRDGYADHYELRFRFATHETFTALEKNSWRWAWEVLKPPVAYLDAALVRRVLLDHLADRVMTVGDRTAIPWIFQATAGAGMVWNRPDDMRAAMGFVGKNIEAADQLLREADRDPSPRGERMRKLGLGIIESFVRLVPMKPPAGEGFDLLTGKPTVSFPPSSWRGNLDAGYRVFLRAPSEDMVVLMRAYNREKKAGRDHPEWLAWCRDFADWLLPQQRPDGSFPRAWEAGTGKVIEPSGTSSYNPVPLLVLLSHAQSGGKRYLDAAVKAGEYIAANYVDRGYFVGGTLDNPNVVDKEAGMLSLEAFLALYEETKNPVWLSRARVAADYAETYIWIWNVPMPVDASEGGLAWKKGVSTVGLQGIGARPGGGVDEYMDWSVPAYARLYRYTGDPHYRDVALVLLHDTKSMLALPGRTYDLAGPGWQQEHWSIGDSRGYSSHRAWLPWVSTNHLVSFTGLEDFDPKLYQEWTTRPAGR